MRKVLEELHRHLSEQVIYFSTVGLPQVVRKIMNHKFQEEAILVKVVHFLKQVLTLTDTLVTGSNAGSIRGVDIEILLDTQLTILDGDQYLYFNKVKIPEQFIVSPQAFAKSEKASPVLIELVNMYGGIEGFTHLFSHIQTGHPNCRISHIRIIVELFYKITRSDALLKEALQSFLSSFQSIVISRLLRISEEEVKVMRKEDMDKIIQNLSFIFNFILTETETAELLEGLHMDVAVKFVLCPFFDKRLYGLQILTMLISYIRNAETASLNPSGTVTSVTNAPLIGPLPLSQAAPKCALWLDSSRMIRCIESNKIIESLFGSRAHQQLLKKSSELFRFLASKRALNATHFDIFWTTITTAHESVSTAMMQVLIDEAMYFSEEQTSILFGRIKSIPIPSLTSTILHLINEFSMKCVFSQSKFMELLWETMLSKEVSQENQAKTLSFLQAAAKSVQFRHLRIEWFGRLVENIKQNNQICLCYEFMSAIICSFPTKVPVNSNQEIAEKFVEKMNTEHKLVDIFFQELCDYHNFWKQGLEDKTFTPEMTNTQYIPKLKVRLNFLKTVLSHMAEDIAQEHYFTLWDTLITSSISQSEADECYYWLVSAREAPTGGYEALDNGSFMRLFVRRMLAPSFAACVTSTTAFRCFSLWFCDANKQEERMTWQPSSEKFEVLKPLDNLLGIQQLWEIILTAENPKVYDSSVQFLHSLSANLSAEMNKTVSQVQLREDFIRSCMMFLTEAVKQHTSTPTDALQKRICQCLTLLRQYVNQCEAGKFVKYHGSCTCGKPLVVVAHIITTSAPTQTSRYELHVDATIGHLRHAIARDLPGAVAPKQIILSINAEVIESDSTALRQLNFFDQQEVTAVVLDKLTPDVTTVMNSHRVIKATPTPPPADSESRAQQLAEMCGITKDVAKLALSKSYWDVGETATALCDEVYRKTILIEAAQLAEQQAATGSELAGLPSYIIASSETHFNVLFKLLDLNDQNLSSMVWDLLLNMPTSPRMLSAIQNFEFNHTSVSSGGLDVSNTPSPSTEVAATVKSETPVVGWESLLESHSLSKLLYSLQIVEGIVFPMEDKVHDDLRDKWCSKFTQSGGLQHICNILLGINFSEVRSSIDQHCVALLIRLISFFCSSSFFVALPEVNFQKILPIVVGILWDTVGVGKAPTITFGKSSYDIICYVMKFIGFCIHNANENSSVIDRTTVDPLLAAFTNPSHLYQSLVLGTDNSVKQDFADGLFNIALQLDFPFQKTLTAALISLFDSSTTAFVSAKAYFSLLKKMVTILSALSFTFEVVTPILKHLWELPILETTPDTTDEVLVGLLEIVQVLLLHSPEKCSSVLPSGVAIIPLLYEWLFALKNTESSALPKCKSPRSRKATMQLMVQICTTNSTYYSELSTLLSSHHNVSIRPPYTWDTHPGSESKSTYGFVGLKNSGNTCYMNSFLQQLFMIKGLVSTINSLPSTDDARSIVYQLQLLFGYLTETEKRAVDTANFCKCWGEIHGEPNAIHRQQDVTEFFHILWQRLEEQLKAVSNSPLPSGGPAPMPGAKPTRTPPVPTPEEISGLALSPAIPPPNDIPPPVSPPTEPLPTVAPAPSLRPLPIPPTQSPLSRVSSYFVGKMVNQTLSADPTYYSEQTEEFHAITLDIKSKHTLQEALDLAVKHDTIEEFKCDEYPHPFTVKRRSCVSVLPPVLILHLKRFEYDFDAEKRVKLNDYIEFPFELCMKPWTKEGLAEKENSTTHKAGPESAVISKPPSYYDFKLVGVLVHSGSADYGHYYSYIKDRKSRYWFEFNDSTVTPYNLDNLNSDCFGGRALTKVWDNVLSQTVQREGTKTNSAYLLFYERDDPHLSDYIPLSIPPDIYKIVWEDNARFLRDKQFIDANYFDFFLSLIKLVKPAPPVLEYNCLDGDKFFQLYKSAVNFLLGTLSHAKYNAVIGQWTKELQECFALHIPACKYFLERAIALGSVKDLILECQEELARVHYCQLFIHCINLLSPYEYDIWNFEDVVESSDLSTGKSSSTRRPKAVVLQFMTSVIDLLETSREYWKRFKQYWMLWLAFAKMGTRQREFLVKSDIIALFVDYFEGNTKKDQTHRTNIIDGTHLPDLRDFFDTLSIVVRSCQCSNKTDVISPYAYVGELLPTPVSLKQLFNEMLLSNFMDMEYNTKATIEMMQHLSWESIDHSRTILDVALQTVDYTDKFPVMHLFLDSFIRIPDSLQTFRVQTLFSPFSTNQSTKGLLAFIADASKTSTATQLLSVIHNTAFVVKMRDSHPIVRAYLEQHLTELRTIETFLQEKLGSQFTPAAVQYAKDEATLPARVPSTPEASKWVAEPLFQTLVALKRSLGTTSQVETPATEISNANQELKDELELLNYTLLYYKQSNPLAPLPHYLETKRWKDFLRTHSLEGAGPTTPATTGSTPPATKPASQNTPNSAAGPKNEQSPESGGTSTQPPGSSASSSSTNTNTNTNSSNNPSNTNSNSNNNNTATSSSTTDKSSLAAKSGNLEVIDNYTPDEDSAAKAGVGAGEEVEMQETDNSMAVVLWQDGSLTPPSSTVIKRPKPPPRTQPPSRLSTHREPGSGGGAAESTVSSGVGAMPAEPANADALITQLSDMMGLDRGSARDALFGCNWNLAEAADRLLGGNDVVYGPNR
ncbi:ubiquitin carboxyl-terminal hydrolase 34 [Pelomyxa schiedti]|nr:ubiquitin carboxyl-terminal hydrolase 34 [Pelomyxa schiedti]